MTFDEAFDEERAGESLRTLMRTAELPSSGANVDVALRTGRRQAGRRRILTAAAVTVGLAATSSLAAVALARDTPTEPAADRYSVFCELTERLPIPPGYTRGYVNGADRSGRFLAGNVQISADHKADPVLWKDKVPTVFEVPGQVALPTAVNGRGDVVGNGTAERTEGGKPGNAAMAWLYRDRRVIDLPAPAGLHSPYTNALNDRGDIVGGAQDPAGRFYAVIWPAGSLEQRRLEGPANATAYGVGADGTVVGSAGGSLKKIKSSNDGQPYLWTPDGRGRQLKVPAGFAGGTAIGVHDGWILGSVYPDRPPSTTRETARPDLTPVRWRITGGAPEIVADVPETLLSPLGPTGWLIANTAPMAWSAPTLINVDGRVRQAEPPRVDPTRTGERGEPIPDPVLGADAVWADENAGRLTVIGNESPEDPAPKPAIWRCQR